MGLLSDSLPGYQPAEEPGLSYAEIWISEAQERMVLAVPAENVQTLLDLCNTENVEATDIGIFDGTGKLTLHFAPDGGEPPSGRRRVRPARSLL